MCPVIGRELVFFTPKKLLRGRLEPDVALEEDAFDFFMAMPYLFIEKDEDC